MKRNNYLLSGLLLVFFISVILCTSVSAASNTSYDTAETIPVNTVVSVNSQNKYSWYATTLDQNGFFYLDFDRASLEKLQYSGQTWKISVRINDKFILDSKRVTASKAQFTSPKYAYPAGTKVYIRIESYKKVNSPYRFTVINKSNNFWEQETNNTKGTANIISVNKEYYGNFAGSGDSYDHYVTTLPKTGVMRLHFGRVDNDGYRSTGNGWKIYISVDGKEVYYTSISQSKAVNGYTTPYFGYKEGQKVYIAIKNNKSSTYVDYKLKVENTPATNWETEQNNSKVSADPIAKNTYYYGNFPKTDKYDYFVYTAGKTGNYKVYLGRRLNDGSRSTSNGWKISVYVDSKLVLNSKRVSEAATVNTFVSSNIKANKGQKIYIKIANNNAGNKTDYKLKIK